jgi:HD-GYP domain-containing protein (c-di-GMP phosphodiesterase class II)
MSDPSLRLAEILGGLAIASDIANGFPQEKVLRTAILATEIGRCAGLGHAELRDAFYVAVLRFLGCTGFAHEEAQDYGAGNDLVTRNVMALADPANPIATLRAIVTRVGEGAPAMTRARAVAQLVLDADAAKKHARAQCDTSMRFAELIGMSATVRDALAQVCERFDGKGVPECTAGERIPTATRLLHVADVAEIVNHRHGAEEAIDEIERRAGKHLDPGFARVFAAHADELLEGISAASVWELFLRSEPEPHALADDARADQVAVAFAHFADLKSVYTLGHSIAVADLAVGAAVQIGVSAAALRDLRHGALLHDIGKVSVPNGIWDRRGPLGMLEWERVRLHARYTEQIVLRAPAWAGAAKIAAAAHERLDASGYHRGVSASLLDAPERILAAADVLQALREPRPHRPAHSLESAAAVLADEARRGLLDTGAVDAVLSVAGAPVARKHSTGPRGLSDREVEVLRHVTRGKSNKEIGILLGMSARTVQNHVAHSYDKIGVSSRAGAALFVVENQLLDG